MMIDTSLILHYITSHYDGLELEKKRREGAANRGALEFHHVSRRALVYFRWTY